MTFRWPEMAHPFIVIPTAGKIEIVSPCPVIHQFLPQQVEGVFRAIKVRNQVAPNKVRGAGLTARPVLLIK
jgi:hypothetical protein